MAHGRDDDSDVRQALAVFGAAPIGYRNFRRAPVPATQLVQPAPRPVASTHLTLQWPAQSLARRTAEPIEASLREVPALRAMPACPSPAADVPHRISGRDPHPPGTLASHPVARPVSATEEGAPRRGKLPLPEMFRALAGSPAAEATPVALPPMFRRL